MKKTDQFVDLKVSMEKEDCLIKVFDLEETFDDLGYFLLDSSLHLILCLG